MKLIYIVKCCTISSEMLCSIYPYLYARWKQSRYKFDNALKARRRPCERNETLYNS